ncbi:MAG: hypothetical protein AB1Z21_02800, partial [Synechococcaceae cyanobacterium]
SGIFDGSVPYRTSDHDPIVVGLNLSSTLPRDVIRANPARRGKQVLAGTSKDEIIDGGNGPARLTGGGGSDVFLLNPGPGVVRITDFQDGTDFLGLAKGLAFEALRFTGNANSGARIRAGSDLLAVLEGVSPDALTAADFVAVADVLA